MRSADRQIMTTGQMVYTVDGWGKDAELLRLKIQDLKGHDDEVVFYPTHRVRWVGAKCVYVRRRFALRHLRSIRRRK